MILPLGSIINSLAVVLGSMIGIYFGSFLPAKIKKTIFQVIGLFTLVLGTKMSLQTNHFFILLVCLVLGSIIGEILSIEKRLMHMGNKVKALFRNENNQFSEGLITSFLLYCIGSMTFVGALEEGINQDRTLLYTKSLMDGITSILLASNLGVGVLASAIPLLIFQSILTIGAFYFGPYFSEEIITEISALGGIMIVAIGLNILKIEKITTSNLLPALLLIIPIHYLFIH